MKLSPFVPLMKAPEPRFLSLLQNPNFQRSHLVAAIMREEDLGSHVLGRQSNPDQFYPAQETLLNPGSWKHPFSLQRRGENAGEFQTGIRAVRFPSEQL